MLKFEQKNYVLPALAAKLLPSAFNTTMAVGTGVGIYQSHEANEKAEEQAEELKRHNKKMEKLAEKQGAQNMENLQKSFGIVPTSVLRGIANVKNNTAAGSFVRDMYRNHSSGIKKAAGVGASFAAMDYVGNRLAQSWKDHDENNDKKTLGALGKIAGTTAVVGGTILAAKKGKLGTGEFAKKAQNFMTGEGKGAKALESIKKSMSPISRDENNKINWVNTGGKTLATVGFTSIPIVGYAAQRNQIKNQVDNQLNNQDNENIQNNYSENEKSGSGIAKKILNGLAVAGTVAGAAYGAKRGVFGAGIQKATGNALATTGSYLNKYGATKSLGGKLMKSGSEAYGQGAAKSWAKGIESTSKAASEAAKEKGIFKDPIKISEDQIKSKAEKLGNVRLKAAESNSPSLLTGTANAISKPLHWFGMMDTRSGVKAMKRAANKMATDPKNGEFTKKVGEWIGKNDRNAAIATVGGGVGAVAVGPTAMGLGSKAVGAITNTIDSGANEMSREQNQKVYSEKTITEKGIKFYPKTGTRTKFIKKTSKVSKPGYKEVSILSEEKTFTQWDNTDQLKGMTDADILAEKKRKESSLNLGKSAIGAVGGSVLGKVAGNAIGKAVGKNLGGTGALAGAAIGGMYGMDKQTRDKTLIGSGLGTAAGIGLGLLTKKPNLYKYARNGALIGGTLGVMSGVSSQSKQNKENEFFNDRLEYAKKRALKREKEDWKNNMNNREGYTY